MSDKFNKELSELYKQVATKQKNTKGVPHMGDSLENFRGRKGVSDVGIPLSPKAAKRKQSNRAGYHYPQHLQNINERRRRDAMAKHGITNIEDPFNQKEKKDKTFTQPAANRSVYWRPPMDDGPRKKRANIYYDDWSTPAEPVPVEYILPPETKKQPAYKAKMVRRDNTLKFKNKLEEDIYNHPNYKKQFK